jgi:methanogenic corrinoid protein MtbC1
MFLSNNQEILDKLARGVRDMDEELTVAAAQEALQNNIGALKAI